MTAFPSYDAALLAALDIQANAMLGVFAAKNYVRVEPPILQPAELFLDRSGEEIRRRTFVLDDGKGRELCLRPELTLPVCRMHLEARGKYPARLCAHGPVFRIPQSARTGAEARPSQFLQTGVECLGVKNRESADLEVLALAVEAVRAAGLKQFTLRIGDVALFRELVDALDVPVEWRGQLKRHFWRPDYFKELLERLSGERNGPVNPYVAEIAAAGPKQARAAAERALDSLGAAPLGGRTREEIVERLLEQAAEAAAIKLDKAAVRLIENVLSVEGPARKSIARIEKLARGARVKLGATLATMETRMDALARLKLGDGQVNFSARFGRNIEYYTGFVFELWSSDTEGAVQIAGGGRYDTLMRSLGAAKDIPAVGCAIRGERVLAARAATGATR